MWNSQIPVLVFNSQSQRIVGVNSAAAALLKAPPEDLEGQTVDCFVLPEERDRLATSIGTSDPRWGDVGIWQCLARDGSRFIAQIRFHQAIHNGQLVHVVLATEVLQLESHRSAAAGFGEPLDNTG